MHTHTKYTPYPTVKLDRKEWTDKSATVAPRWVSTDLRDGNQALANPMGIEQKVAYFKALVEFGFKEIEIAYPSASQTEFDFCRRLIEEGLIPEDVTIGVHPHNDRGCAVASAELAVLGGGALLLSS